MHGRPRGGEGWGEGEGGGGEGGEHTLQGSERYNALYLCIHMHMYILHEIIMFQMYKCLTWMVL
jgi:hypothetical protein